MSGETTATSSASPTANLTSAASLGEDSKNVSSALVATSEHEPSDTSGTSTVTADSPLARLPLQLDVTVPIPSFRVEDLLTLEKDTVLESGWSHTEDVPVWCGGVQLAWTEFEVVDEKLAVRVTRIS